MYGYRIENGIAVIDEQEAAVIIDIFNGYLSGMSLTAAAENAGQPMVLLWAGTVCRLRHISISRSLWMTVFPKNGIRQCL